MIRLLHVIDGYDAPVATGAFHGHHGVGYDVQLVGFASSFRTVELDDMRSFGDH